MLKVREALKEFNGQVLDLVELRKALKSVVMKHLSEIPAEFKLRDLFDLAREENCIEEVGQGRVRILAS